MPQKVFAPLFDDLLAEGVVAVTAEQLAARARSSLASVYLAVHRAKTDRKLFSPTPGLYVLVPPQYRSWGVVPADWFIDDMMTHLGHHYYVGLLTAAAHHGARHQASQVFQVITDARILDREVATLRLRFYRASDITDRPTMVAQGPTGRLIVATPETCALDLAERPAHAGGINTILEVLADLDVDVDALASAAQPRPRAVIRRCGWLLENSRTGRDVEALQRLAAPTAANPTPLVPGGELQGTVDRRWGVIVNTTVEAVA